MSTIQNAQIRRTFLGTEDHGIFTWYITIEGPAWGTSYGGYALDEPQRENGKFVRRYGTGDGLETIKRVLDTLEVESWEKLPGTFVRAKSEDTQMVAIGHLLKDQWFSLKDFFEKRKEKAA